MPGKETILKFRLIIVFISLFMLWGCTSNPQPYDVQTSMQLFTEDHGGLLLASKVAEIKGYFRPGQHGMGPLVIVSTDTPTFSITDPKQIHDFFHSLWAPSHALPPSPITDGLAFVVIMKDPDVRPAYFHGYMSSGHLHLVTPLTDFDACTAVTPELDKYLHDNFLGAAWLH